jgi:hypothetical protein
MTIQSMAAPPPASARRLLPDGLGIDAGAQDLLPLAVEPGEEIEIEEAIVQRRHQRIGMGMADARETGIAARRIDDDKVAILELGQRRGEAGAILGRRHGRGIQTAGLDRDMAGKRQRQLARRGLAVLDVAGECALAGVEIDAAHAHPAAQQRHDHMHCRGGFARAALLVPENDDMRLAADDGAEVDGHAFRIQMAVSWKTAPPFGGPASALVSALTPIPSSKAPFGQMLSTTTTPGCSPSKIRA